MQTLPEVEKEQWGFIWGICRYIDDGIFIHLSDEDGSGMLAGIYPAHLTRERGVQKSLRRIVFLDLTILDLLQPAYCTHFKPTHSATYLPWESNTPHCVQSN